MGQKPASAAFCPEGVPDPFQALPMYISRLSGPFCIKKALQVSCHGLFLYGIRFIGNCFPTLTGVVFPLPSYLYFTINRPLRLRADFPHRPVHSIPDSSQCRPRSGTASRGNPLPESSTKGGLFRNFLGITLTLPLYDSSQLVKFHYLSSLSYLLNARKSLSGSYH